MSWWVRAVQVGAVLGALVVVAIVSLVVGVGVLYLLTLGSLPSTG